MARKAKPTDLLKHSGDLPANTRIADKCVSFSLRFIDLGETGLGLVHAEPAAYTEKLFMRLKDLCSMRTFEVLNNKSLWCHAVRWHETAKPHGFRNLPQHLQEITPYQLALETSNYGRIFGFFIDDVFYIVWCDPHHAVYPKD